MSCDNDCYEADINGCGDITVKAGLAASTSYFIIVTKNTNNNAYQRQLTTDASGFLVIPKDIFPAGYFTGGYFRLVVKLASSYTLQPLTFNTIAYNCVLLHVVNTDIETSDTSPIYTVQ